MELITTADGSHTLFSKRFNEIYHSRHGALQESRHVFIQNGWNYVIEKNPGIDTIRIFEVGFGTGLNALLTLIEAEKRKIKVDYESIELYPVPVELVKELNYPALLEETVAAQPLKDSLSSGSELFRNELQKNRSVYYPRYQPPFHSLHLCNWNEEQTITPFFSIRKISGSLTDCQLPTANPPAGEAGCQLIFFDAFAPEHQPEMWTEEVFSKMYHMLAPSGVLVTYCSKSIVQKAMRAAGFSIEKLAGPPGKREMVRASKL